ncbi:hypothetical protein [Marisediminicola senii]|uniref:hypothetical protein n=1 Tax=Marisediminicola senii TaxID=2711233 RepID=UPI0013EBD226|nr:hypothetical protein [Marisediminicola senii]
MGIRRGATTITGVIAALLLVTACASTSDYAAPRLTERPSVDASASPTPSATPTPSPSETIPPTTEPLANTVQAGSVAEGASATISGTGPSNVAYQRQGEFAVVVGLDCSACTGTAIVTAPGRMSPLGEVAAPMQGSFLVDVFQGNPVDQMVIVQAEGAWTVTLQSWNDLPYVTGAQSGTGPRVMFFTDDVPRVTVEYTPADADDSFSGRVFTTSDTPQVFGNTEAISEVFDADLPGVMAIQTRGTWTVTPTP